ncbi:MAG: pitrilysin family protein [Bacilli bacterium]
MEYKKIIKRPYNIHFIKTDKFKKVRIKINFKTALDKEKIVTRNMLSLILLDSTKKFKTKRLLDIQSEELYNVGIEANTNISGSYHLLSFNLVYLLESYTEPGMTEKTIQFFLDFIFNPNIIDNKFDETSYKNAYNYLIEDINSYEDNPNQLALNNLYQTLCPNTGLDYKNTGYIEDLEKLTNEKLYQYYKELLNDNLIDIFVVGNFNESEMQNIIEKNFQINTLKAQGTTHIITHKKYRPLPIVVKDKKNINQSILLIGAKLMSLTNFERLYTLPIYNSILGGTADSKLFKNVREKNSLCYSVSSTFSGLGSLMVISAGINAKDFKKTVSLIKKEIKNMSKGDYTEREIEQAKTTYIASLKEIEDNQSSIISIYEAHEYLDYALINEREENIKKVTKQMILDLNKKIKLDTIYFLEGGKTSEE